MSVSIDSAITLFSHLQSLFELLPQVKNCDAVRFKKRLMNLKKLIAQEARGKSPNELATLPLSAKQMKLLEPLQQHILKSIQDKQQKIKNLPKITYPDGLPISDNAAQISAAIEANQVVIIAGETGSGKTTQIPKICLALGRGVDGLIGHTQPRRIAARTVANRIAEELGTTVGEQVGYKVRFNDQVSEQSYIKLMTDGILLAEMQRDRLLLKYDTIIIDEAHERSLNIDFILGYLKQILVKRPDLKLIITSATIDPQRFAKHFSSKSGIPAPVIEVSGRTFPVEMRYRPLNDRMVTDEDDQSPQDVDIISGILSAVDELSECGQGDILVFLNGEREIRDTAAALTKANLRHTNILPLYARLTVSEQNQIFKPHSGRNIVLATNVAETSLTVPGIKYVIDPGTARISRYSYRTKVQRLPIEPVSQASANQRSGRCGRVSEGICIRLYSEDDYKSRAEFTDPEILRTNLATVILQMHALDLGDIANFPFVEAPDNRNITDGVRLLEEIAAVESLSNSNSSTDKDKSTKGKQSTTATQLTKSGRLLAKFPIDPRLAKMVITAIEFGCIEQILIIVSALSIQDPRERPHEKQQLSDEKHNRFKNKTSDFISLLNLWQYINVQKKDLTQNQFRKLCQREYLSYVRLREWQDIFSQLKLTLKEQNIALTSVDYRFSMPSGQQAQEVGSAVDKEKESEQDSVLTPVHQALLSGLLSHIGQQDENREYKGARGMKFFIFPGSALTKKSPKWLMSAELVETSRLFARMNAKIDPLWLEPLAQHLVKRNYSEPHWEKKQGAVMAFEQVTLYGLSIVTKRKINFNTIEPATCREIFIREALVNGDCVIKEKFLSKNQQLVESIEELEQKARRRDFLIDEQHLVDFYSGKLPDTIVCQRSFLAWWKKAKQENASLLDFTKAFLLNESVDELSATDYPDFWQQDRITLPLTYHFSPGDIDDGISVIIPIALLNQVQDMGFDWLIPALRDDLAIALIKALPKTLRRNFVPAPNYAQACVAAMPAEQGSLQQALAKQLLRMTGVRLPEEAWQDISLPVHLTMNFQVVDDKGDLLKQGRDLNELKAELQGKVKASIKKVAEKGIEQADLTQWDFGALPKGYEKKIANITIKAFPALVDHQSSVAIELFEQEQHAQEAMLKGISRLILLNIPTPLKYLQEKLPNKAKLGLYFNPFGSINDLLQDCIQGACLSLVQQFSQQQNNGQLPREEKQFSQCCDYVRAEIADCVLTAAIKVERALTLRHEVTKKMKGSVPLNVIQSHGDIKQQCEQLVFKGFVSNSGLSKLDDIIRYLQGMLRRLEKLPSDPNQDRLKLIEVNKVNELYQVIMGKQRKDKPIESELLATRWLIEELRISLFAQNLGTSAPISAKRILNHLKGFA
ncbi:ATP-dependent RNA helicase HrpA [Colwellia sp. 12G3]|uniref:ATP-dependent RNA helicase HrpA n=1 Tax=Colwellia sp. 12G3 TaxID=2058299 RepID=UPI000C31FFC2|nr:ATP-dependent RNA helicase HrpA [Colwellia sp. 12G3]PKI17523.1 ATP-dependent RNA helicase HrpA [Colwellia sp. 12G3]